MMTRKKEMMLRIEANMGVCEQPMGSGESSAWTVIDGERNTGLDVVR